MCEFCLNPNLRQGDRDALNPSFAGFFSPEAIEAAVRQANANRQPQQSQGEDITNTGEDDDDGT